MSRAATAFALLQEQGAGAVMDRIGDYVRPYLVLDESHIWYRLDVTMSQAAPTVPPGLTVREGTKADLPLLERLPTIGQEDARRRLEAGSSLWLALDGGEPLFACWLFRGAAPVIAARGGRLRLPSDVVMLEDSVAHPAARGRGIAPLTWQLLAEAERLAGTRLIITKVAVDNAPSRKACVKAGFLPMAMVRFRRIAGRGARTELFPAEASADARWLADALPAIHPFLSGRDGSQL